MHSVTKSALQCAANTSSSFAFLQVGIVDGIPFSSCTVYRYLCDIFLDDISTREQFAFLVYCYRVKATFTIYALCFTGVSVAWQIAPCPLNWGWCAWDAEGSKNGFRMANWFCCLSQNAMVCLAHCRQELRQKSWKTVQTFSSRPRRRPRPNVQDQDQDSFLSSRRLETKTLVSTPGLHHCLWLPINVP